MIVPALDWNVAEEDWPRIGLSRRCPRAGGNFLPIHCPSNCAPWVFILDERHLKREGALDECSISNRVE